MKLHELLAVESSLETQAQKVRKDLENTFEKKRHLFEKKQLLFTPSAEGAQQSVEQQQDIQTTVEKEIKWIRPHISKSLDSSYQVAEANMLARADIVLEDDTVIAKDVPATSLLELQKRLAEIMELAKSIPTLDPAKGFSMDEQSKLYKAREIKKPRTTKQPKVIIKYEATKEHPAQTELYSADVVLGMIEEQEWSGLMTPADKADLLDRVEKLTRAVRSARSRANEQAVDTSKKISAPLLNYIFG